MHLEGTDNYAELLCQGRPSDGVIVRVIIRYECPATFPLPHGTGTQMRISINDDELVTERYCFMNGETIEITVPEMVLTMRDDLRIRIGMVSESRLWIRRIEVEYGVVGEQ